MSLYAQSLENAGKTTEAFQIYKDLSAEKDLCFQTKESNLALRWENLNKLYHTQKRDFKGFEAKLKWFEAITAALAALALSAFVLLYIKTLKPAAKTVSKAEELYQRLTNNESIAQWSKDERDIVAEYYMTQNADFEREISTNYDKLPTNSIILLILQNIGKSKTEIMDIMGFSDQAYRSLKSRTDRAKK
jgi:predicted nucleic acid-binding protein